jgi:hypothetical protein
MIFIEPVEISQISTVWKGPSRGHRPAINDGLNKIPAGQAAGIIAKQTRGMSYEARDGWTISAAG